MCGIEIDKNKSTKDKMLSKLGGEKNSVGTILTETRFQSCQNETKHFKKRVFETMITPRLYSQRYASDSL